MTVNVLVHCSKVVCLLMVAGPVLKVISLDLFFHIKSRLNSGCVTRYLEWAKVAVGHAFEIQLVTLTEIYRGYFGRHDGLLFFFNVVLPCRCVSSDSIVCCLKLLSSSYLTSANLEVGPTRTYCAS